MTTSPFRSRKGRQGGQANSERFQDEETRREVSEREKAAAQAGSPRRQAMAERKAERERQAAHAEVMRQRRQEALRADSEPTPTPEPAEPQTATGAAYKRAYYRWRRGRPEYEGEG